jgi:ParB family chromosome partitioning protein
MLGIDEVLPCPGQPRKDFNPDTLSELAASISRYGVIQPIIVTRKGGFYQIVIGERRWRAACDAGLKEVPAIVEDLSERQAMEMALIENLHRDDINPIEEAMAYESLLGAYSYTQDELSASLGKSRPSITNALRLLRLPGKVRDDIAAGALSAGHGRALLPLGDEALILEARDRIVTQGLSVRQAEEMVRKMMAGDGGAIRRSDDDSRWSDYRQTLERSLGAKVVIHGRKKDRGTIEIHFDDADDLERLMDAMCAARSGGFSRGRDANIL